MKSVEILPTPLNGSIDIPPSKSLCHRAIIAASLARGSSTINNLTLSEDILATIDAVQALGAKVTLEENKAFIEGTDFSSCSKDTIDCRESGSTLRFMIPIGLLTGQKIKYIGSGNLGSRPLGPYIEIFNDQKIEYNSSRLPLSINGRLMPGEFRLRGDISSQFITGLMFTLPMLQGDSTIYITTPLESRAYIDLTIDTLKSFGVHVESFDYNHFYIKGKQRYKPTEFSVEGDYSQAAFWIASGLLGGQVECTNLSQYSKQGDKAIIDILRNAGAQILAKDNSITAVKSTLTGFNADVSQYPDIAPILSVIAAVSKGTSRITGAARLRLKECDRLRAVATELNKLGAEVIEGKDYLVINGKERLNGGVVDCWNDHRIAMALSIASIKCTSPLIIENSNSVAKSYPDFFEDFTKLGGIVNERSLG